MSRARRDRPSCFNSRKKEFIILAPFCLRSVSYSWHYVEPAIGYAKFFSRSHDAVIRIYDEAGNVIETQERQMSGSTGKQ